MKLEEFYDWMEEHDALHPFIKNCDNEEDLERDFEKTIKYTPTIMISIYFNWGVSPEKGTYWRELDDEFMDFLEERNVNELNR